MLVSRLKDSLSFARLRNFRPSLSALPSCFHFRKMIVQETTEKKSRMATTALATGPAERMRPVRPPEDTPIFSIPMRL
jgi:hypothetical protein